MVSIDKMNLKNGVLTEAEIDDLVTAEADEDAAWKESIQAHKAVSSLPIPPNLAKCAAFLARLHREKSLEAWLTHIIEERIELEEGAFLQANRELTGQSTVSITV